MPPLGPPPQAIFAGESESASFARAYVREAVSWQAPGLAAERVDDVVLVASELVTNSIRYGTEPGDSLRVVVDAEPGRVRIEVHDPVRRQPYVPFDPGERQRGRGMWIVDALATWGVDEQPLGKSVWAELTWR
ncbi:ATP-binding protein [Streptomyces sp. NPDC058394]|uniref:ATP-binding protein n=1 Tax=Streptomyces sp. NPDC058394 TaxID=3346477 RepID=UPI00364C368A